MMAVRSDHRSPSVSAPTISSSPAIAAYLSSGPPEEVFGGGALRVKIDLDPVIN